MREAKRRVSASMAKLPGLGIASYLLHCMGLDRGSDSTRIRPRPLPGIVDRGNGQLGDWVTASKCTRASTRSRHHPIGGDKSDSLPGIDLAMARATARQFAQGVEDACATCSGVMRLKARINASTSRGPIGRSRSMLPSSRKTGLPGSAAVRRCSAGAVSGLRLACRADGRSGGNLSTFMRAFCKTELEQTIQSRPASWIVFSSGIAYPLNRGVPKTRAGVRSHHRLQSDP